MTEPLRSMNEFYRRYYPNAHKPGSAEPGGYAVCTVCGDVRNLTDAKCPACAKQALEGAGWREVPLQGWVCGRCRPLDALTCSDCGTEMTREDARGKYQRCPACGLLASLEMRGDATHPDRWCFALPPERGRDGS